ncbi:NADH-dependent phenylglyoxylate dehydrogenase subunit epsilon [subsurface metagenome]
MHIAVIGNGAAGNNAALTAGNLNGKVSIVSEEPYPAYSACALKYYLSGDIPRQHLFLKTIEDYSEADINTIFDKKVEGIDVKRQKINFQNGSLSYDKLVIATGAESLIPSITGIKKRGVFTFKSLEDTDKILDYPMSEAVIIGSGFIGVEIGTTLKKKGISVTLVELKERILPRAFDKKPAHIIETILKEHGIKILTEERVVQILGKAEVEGVKTGKREIRADAVILASGMKPRVALARSAGIKIGTSGGIATNEQMMTNIENIYACGDCAESQDIVTCRKVLHLIWPNAVLQGKIAGYNCAAGSKNVPKKYRGFVNTVCIDILGTPAASIGLTAASLSGDHLQITEKGYGKNYHRLVVKDGVIVGGQFIGKMKNAGVLSQAIWKRAFLEETIAAAANRRPLAINPLYLKIKQYKGNLNE